jgi:putative ABC transport system substrate-binding protein
VARWNSELRDLGCLDPDAPVRLEGTQAGWVDRDAAADLVVSILGSKRSAWNTADIRGKTEILLAQTALVVAPLQRETSTVPIIFMQIVDPVESGFVASLARPGGNLTGFTPFEFSTATKWLEILKEIAPGVTRVATILSPVQSPQVKILRAIEAMAPSVGLLLTPAGVSDAAEMGRAVDAFAREPNGGLIVVPNAVTISHRELIIALAARHHLPAVYAYRYFVADGGLISYGPHFWSAPLGVDRWGT